MKGLGEFFEHCRAFVSRNSTGLAQGVLLLSALALLPLTVTHSIHAQEQNVLTPEEKSAGWQSLFDGKTTTGWRGYRSGSVPASWKVEDGSLLSRHEENESTGDILTAGEYDNFELVLEWRMTPGGNSGVFYRATEDSEQVWESAAEYQILDNAEHMDGLNPLASAGACYAVFPPCRDATLPVGEWNKTRIIALSKHVEHWLNGEKILEYEIDSEYWLAHVKTSRYFMTAYGQGSWGRAPKGHIALQDYGGGIEYRNIKILPLAAQNQATQP